MARVKVDCDEEMVTKAVFEENYHQYGEFVNILKEVDVPDEDMEWMRKTSEEFDKLQRYLENRIREKYNHDNS